MKLDVNSAMLKLVMIVLAALTTVGTLPAAAQSKPDTKEIQKVAEEAYLYGFPMVVGYSVLNNFFINRNSGQFKAPINQISNTARVFTPKDTGISTPNSDTPYSMALLDLRAEPMVLCMPEIERDFFASPTARLNRAKSFSICEIMGSCMDFPDS